MDRRPENTEREIEIKFLDSRNQPVEASTYRYAALNEHANYLLLDWTDVTLVTPATTDVVTISATLNQIRNRSNKVERICLVVATAASTDEYRYEIQRVAVTP